MQEYQPLRKKRNTGHTYWEGRNTITPIHRQRAYQYKKTPRNYEFSGLISECSKIIQYKVIIQNELHLHMYMLAENN